MPLAWGKKLDKSVPIPLYFQLKTLLLDAIKRGDYPVNGMIPTEKELSEMFGISRTTVRQAVTGAGAGRAGSTASPARAPSWRAASQAGFYQAAGNVQRADPPHGPQAQHRAVGHARRRHAPPAAQQLRRRWGRALCLPLPPPLRRRRAHRHGGNVSALRPLRLRALARSCQRVALSTCWPRATIPASAG